MNKKSRYKINNQINASTVRAISADGKLIGVLPLPEVIALAQEQGQDVIEIAPMAKPPVVRVIEFGKFKYIEEKKEREQKKKSKVNEVKEVRLSPFIAEGDYQTRLSRINRFLKQGNKIRLVIVFKGRHLNSKKFGYELIKRVIGDIGHEINVDMDPKFLGRHLATVISPMKKKKVNIEEDAKDQN